MKDNILYYMQAIWSHEPNDQRFFRVFDKKITVPVADAGTVNVTPRRPGVADELAGHGSNSYQAAFPVKLSKVETKQMNEIADLDTVLGYKGNYAIYPLTENNFVTLSMMLDYLEYSDDDVIKLRDPDPFGDYTVAELMDLAECVKKRSSDTFKVHAKDFETLIIKRLLSGRSEDDRVIVPTDGLYLEALVGTHPLLEDFKLLHRALDVKKVQADVRHAELENVRLAARALRGKDGDPDIDKKIVISNDGANLTVQPDTP